MLSLFQFLFIVAVPLLLVAGGLVSLFALGALFDMLENPADFNRRIEALFNRPPAPPKTPGPKHYYHAHWSAR